MASDITVFCGVYRRENVVCVAQALDATASSLRDALSLNVNVRPHDLKLYLAQKNGEWLKAGEDTTRLLLGGPAVLRFGGTKFQEIRPEQLLKTLFKNTDGQAGVIHVLVEIVQLYQRTLVEPLLTTLQRTPHRSGFLPNAGDFLRLFEWNEDDCGEVKDIAAVEAIVGFTGPDFYVRKEILCVLENFQTFLQDELSAPNSDNQFIFVGSPGTGKSSIMALICFYLATIEGIQVVWHRSTPTGGKSKPVTCLFDNGKYYEWIDIYGFIYESMCDPDSGIEHDRCWFCIDGLKQDDLERRVWPNLYTMLATSGQFRTKGAGGSKQKICLVPYWKQTDLEDLARKIPGLDESDAANRHFVTGGNLRAFLMPVAASKALIEAALGELTSDVATLLLSPRGCSSDQQIDRIRMMGVVNPTSVDHYIRPLFWRPCITSVMAMRHLTDTVKPDYFQKLLALAKDLDDDKLHGAVLEYLFRSLLRHHQSTRISYLTYENVNRKHVGDTFDIMVEDVGTVRLGRSIESHEQLLFQRSGETIEDFVAVMKGWAANPAEMDYWIPASSVCPTIDAVAKWKFTSESVDSSATGPTVERFCLLQMTKAIKHKCDETILWNFAKPFLEKRKKVCFMMLLWDDRFGVPVDAGAKKRKFRLDLMEMKTDEVKSGVPVYVAELQMLDSQQ